jgi:hypothetical protein
MPQLSLYFDQPTLDRVEKAARDAHLSVSKWVRSRLSNSLNKNWPEGYFDLFGSIKDDSFSRPESPSFGIDVKREEI